MNARGKTPRVSKAGTDPEENFRSLARDPYIMAAELAHAHYQPKKTNRVAAVCGKGNSDPCRILAGSMPDPCRVQPHGCVFTFSGSGFVRENPGRTRVKPGFYDIEP